MKPAEREKLDTWSIYKARSEELQRLHANDPPVTRYEMGYTDEKRPVARNAKDGRKIRQQDF